QPPEVIEAARLHIDETPDVSHKETIPPIITMLKKIDVLNVDNALAGMGGLYDEYEKSVRLTARLLPDSIIKMDGYLADGDIVGLKTEVHGIRGVFYNIGASAIGNLAAKIEKAASDGRNEFCYENYPVLKELLLSFLNQLNKVVNSISAAEKEMINKDVLAAAINAAKIAAEDYDANQAIEVLQPLFDSIYFLDIGQLFEEIVYDLEEYKCEEATSKINKIEEALLSI
ncbi:MAG: Hpt domain-containing protein, partial [Lachnospiraceae bacterium]|nr:Hpt domain-containing protein [Lachnospiraceae bacterium]